MTESDVSFTNLNNPEGFVKGVGVKGKQEKVIKRPFL